MRFFILLSVVFFAIYMAGTYVNADMPASSSVDGYEFVEVDAYNESPFSPCPNGCNNHGVCTQDGQCVCFDGWGGPSCATASCPKACSQHGNCVDGICHCRPGWAGYDCSHRGCPDNCSGHGACHISPFVSECVCFPGYVGAKCEQVDPDFADPTLTHTGCKDDCNHNGMCVEGRCQCSNGWSGLTCEVAVCKDNCNGRGFCNPKTGVCQCIDTQRYSGAACEIKSCPNNCSGHGVCLPSGLCQCDKGFFGADCSPNNCEENCNYPNGECIVPKPTTYNGTNIIDPRAEAPRGQCKCSPFFQGPSCSVRRCPNDCSGKGTCDENTYTCQCIDGWSGAACNMKPCEEGCVHGACLEGKCMCEPDWTGVDCSTKRQCNNHCNNHGSCRAGKCFCLEGYYGEDCAYQVNQPVTPAPLIANDGSVVPPGQKTCSPSCIPGQGICVVEGRNDPICRCADGFTGNDCGSVVPFSIYANNTKSTNATTATPAAAAAAAAGKPASFFEKAAVPALKLPPAGQAQCSPVCGLGGRCVVLDGQPQCVCIRGYFGKTCELKKVAPVASIPVTNTTNNATKSAPTAPAASASATDKAKPAGASAAAAAPAASAPKAGGVSLMETAADAYERVAVQHYFDEDGLYALEEDKFEDEMLLRALDQIVNI